MTTAWTPPKAAHRLVRIANAFSTAHGTDRFPVDVARLALESGSIFGWEDSISKVQAANIRGFEGALFPDEGRKNWLLLYNDDGLSEGRIRFTQAHELGHYILHRHLRDSFECTSGDMLDWSDDDANIESQADLFASYLLMPLDDYRAQVTELIDFDQIGHCAQRYGVSLTAASLKWLNFTTDKAVLVVSNNGFIDWAWSSKSAFKAGAFIRTKNRVVPIPERSVASNLTMEQDRGGTEVPASVWFPHADSNLSLREMKIFSNQHEMVLTLLHLPNEADCWPDKHLS